MGELNGSTFNAQLEAAQAFFESVQAFNSPGRMKNFRHSAADIQTHKAALDVLDKADGLREFIMTHSPAVAWLTTAEQGCGVSSGEMEDAWAAQVKTTRREILDALRLELDKERPELDRLSADTGRRLKQLKRDYINQYIALHARARLGLAEDKRKVALQSDPRLAVLVKLAGIELMPRQQLVDFQNRLVGLKSCFALTDHELENSPVCPHCGFQPVGEPNAPPAQAQLQALDAELERLPLAWTKSLLDNLADPITQDKMKLLSADEQARLAAFMQAGELPEQVDNDFIHALQEVFSGLVRVVLKQEDLRQALRLADGPAAPAELKKRFEDYIDGLAKGQNPDKVRIVAE